MGLSPLATVTFAAATLHSNAAADAGGAGATGNVVIRCHCGPALTDRDGNTDKDNHSPAADTQAE